MWLFDNSLCVKSILIVGPKWYYNAGNERIGATTQGRAIVCK